MELRPLGAVSGERSDELEAERPILYPQGLSREQARVLQAAYGDAVEDNRLLNYYNRDREGVWRPFAGFPHAWIAVEMAAGFLLDPQRGIPSGIVGRRAPAPAGQAAEELAAKLSAALAAELRRHGIEPDPAKRRAGAPNRRPPPTDTERMAQGYREARAEAAR